MRNLGGVVRRVPFVILGFIFFYFGGFLLGWLFLPLVRLISWHRVEGQKRCQRIVAGGFRLLLWYLKLIGLYDSGTFSSVDNSPRKLELDKGAVLIANHPTLLDVVLIKSQLGHGLIVIKPIYYFNPLLGTLAWCCGYIRSGSSIGRGAVVIQQAVKRIEEGFTVIVFPEGTRSNPDEMLPFKRGAFMMAERANAPIAAVRIECTPRVLGRAQGFRGYPARGAVKLFAYPIWKEEPALMSLSARESASFWEDRYRGLLKGDCE